MTHENLESAGFASVLRDRTKTIHREAERSGFIAELIRGRATREGYALFLRNLVPAYGALEAALAPLETRSAVAAFANPHLRRLPALQADLAAIAGADWAMLPIVAAATAYAAAIDTAAAADELRLVAHAYARYLGDLSGGQILKPLLARNLGLGPNALAFYDFPALPDAALAKTAMREALDALPADGARSEAVVEEAIAAFRHNIAVSEAVQASLG